tara:strand:- start:2461 stop:3465 length:1005 start_codon:yes stop_codon:yes gene_type:complete
MIIFRNLTICFFVIVGALAGASHAAVLKIATLSPEGSDWMKVLRQSAKEIDNQTSGRIKLKIYSGGVMGDDKAVMRKMRIGQLQGAVLTSGGLVNSYKDIGIYGLPMLFRDQAEVDSVRAQIDPALMVGMSEKGFIGFGLAGVGFAYPMSQIRATSVGEVRKMKIWTPDNDLGALTAFEAFEISPIPLPYGDVLMGLQTGLINGIAAPPVGTLVLQWHTQVSYALDLPLLYVYGSFVLSKKSFEKLSQTDRVIVSDILEEAVRRVDTSAKLDDLEAKEALTRQDIEWLKPSDRDFEEWEKLAEVSRNALVQDDYVSDSLYKQVLSILEKSRASN